LGAAPFLACGCSGAGSDFSIIGCRKLQRSGYVLLYWENSPVIVPYPGFQTLLFGNPLEAVSSTRIGKLPAKTRPRLVFSESMSGT
jgi:hypothetical protein